MKEYVNNTAKQAFSGHRGRYSIHPVKRIFTTFLGITILTTTLITALLPVTDIPVYAAGTGKNLQLGATALAPVMTSVQEQGYDPDEKYRVTTAQTVYYGSSGTQKWYVIGANGTGAVQVPDTVTLFAENNLATDQKYQAAGNSNSYVNSDIKSVVDGYYGSLFTNIEKSQIAERNLYHGEYNPDSRSFCDGVSDTDGEGGAPATKANLWLLSTKEADLVGRSYREANGFWWLRSPGVNGHSAAFVDDDGYVCYDGEIVFRNKGVRPAFNLNLSSIILTSAAEGGKNPATAGTLEAPGDYTGTGWKLTLHDSKMITRIGTAGVSRSGSTITVPYTVNGDNAGDANRISVLITDKEYTASDAVIKYYGNLAITGNIGDSGTGTFTLPTDYNTSWKVYILSEQIIDDKKTDYASTPVEITIPDAPVVETCNISFDANGGKGEMDDQTVDKGVKTQLNKNRFTRDGYSFDSWNTDPDGDGSSYDDKDYITVEKDTTLYAQWKKGKPKHDDDEETEEPSKPAVVNPDTVEGCFAVNGQPVPGVAMGKTVQGVAAQAVFNATRPAGFLQAFTFNMAINGKVDYTLKNGVLTIIIPKEFQNAGRTFAIMALDKNGKAWTFTDTDTNPATVTATINVEGYAFALIYKD